ncbi:hypothetical protein [Burkholderia vietnamiensis]|uniref:hypothetical protein n=1 Tax=Burkholderia vietnamiensis TaxID=60552 RepID=UPI000AB807B8|nr:hypothetical protein [Burkholderia vietnamiensis]
MNIEQTRHANAGAEQKPTGAPGEVERIVRDANHHPTYPRTCLSCGARESLDGSVPCGH